jgi:hypothetical protein
MDDDDLKDEDWVSQYGTIHMPIEGMPFKRRPSLDEYPQELSLLKGKLTADEAAQAVNRRRTHGAFPGDGSRHALVGKLRAAGFRVWATPTKRIPGHVSVAPLDCDRRGPKMRWTDSKHASNLRTGRKATCE